MKKWFLLIAVLLISILVLSACGPSTGGEEAVSGGDAATAEPSGGGEAQAEAVELTFSVWGDPEELAILQEIADAFQAENPNITVTVTVSDWDTYWDKLQTTLAAGNPPDVFSMDAPLYLDYQSRGVLLNLQPYMDAESFDLSDYYEVSLQCYQTEDGYYGLPRDVQPIVMYYNKDMFDAAGVAYPDETWTWETLVEEGQKLTLDTDGDGITDQYALWADLWDMELYWGAAVWQNGGEILGEDFSKTLLGEPAAMETWQYIYDMIFTSGIMPTPSTAEQFGDPFESGNAAMTPAGHWVVPYYSGVDFDWDVAPLPMGKERVSMVNSVGFVAANASKHPDEAWAFLKYLVGEPGQSRVTSLGLGVPALKSIANSDAYLNQPTKAINHELFLQTMDYARVKPCFRGYEEWATLFGDGMYSIWLGEAGLEETMNDLVPQADAILAEAQQ